MGRTRTSDQNSQELLSALPSLAITCRTRKEKGRPYGKPFTHLQENHQNAVTIYTMTRTGFHHYLHQAVLIRSCADRI